MANNKQGTLFGLFLFGRYVKRRPWFLVQRPKGPQLRKDMSSKKYQATLSEKVFEQEKYIFFLEDMPDLTPFYA